MVKGALALSSTLVSLAPQSSDLLRVEEVSKKQRGERDKERERERSGLCNGH